VIVAAIAAFSAIVSASVSAVFGFLLMARTRTPSGDTLGEMSERTHDLTAGASALLIAQEKRAQRVLSELELDRREREAG